MTLDGFEATRRALVSAPEVARTYASDAVGRSSFAIAQRARAMVPVHEGALKASIEGGKVSARSLVGRVGLSAGPALRYWYFVEFGTIHMTARPFFRPAAEQERNEFITRMQRIGPLMERDLSAGRFA